MMKPSVEPYLFFGGRCEEALEFYRTTLGATVEYVLRYRDQPGATLPGELPAGFEDKVMHATFRIGDSVLLASDGCEEGAKFHGFSLLLALPTEADVDRVVAALAVGGEVGMPPARTFWSARFGMVTDRFGVNWKVTVKS